MIILSVNNLKISFSVDVIFDNVNFEVHENDKIGFVGVNGSGKTTLFKILKGEYEQDSGDVIKSSGLSIGYMEQHVVRDSSVRVYDEALSVFAELISLEKELDEIHKYIDMKSKESSEISEDILEKQMHCQERYESLGGLTYESRTRSALLGVGFSEEDLSKPVGVLSGGEKSKLQLVKLLISGHDLLLLDEPTNHLDINSLSWLEKFLCDFRGAFIVISHDRYFLDSVTERTIEIENNTISGYKGNYSTFLVKKEEARKSFQKKYDLDMKEIERIEGIIEQQKRFNQRENYITIASKQKSIDRIKAQLIKPPPPPPILRFRFNCKDGAGNEILNVNSLTFKIEGRTLIDNADIYVRRRERVFLLGGNGTGKTSLFRCLTGEYKENSGEISYGARVAMGYYDQAQGDLHDEKRVIDEIWDRFPKYIESEVRTALGQFLFFGDDVFKKVKNLSGGEKARILLLILMHSGYNFLLLDEPTNHLDITSREALEKALDSYPETLFIISHDRYLINKLATRIYELEDGKITEYAGNYDYYLERKYGISKSSLVTENNSAGLSVLTMATEKTTSKPQEKPNDYKKRRELESLIRRQKGKIARMEEQIESVEQKIAELNDELIKPENSTDFERINELLKMLSDAEDENAHNMHEWEEQSNTLTEFEKELDDLNI